MSLFLAISTIWAVVAIVLLIFSWRLARAGKIRVHKTLMTLLTLGAWVFVASYLFTQRYGDAAAIPFPKEHVIWMAVHGTIGLIPLVGATCLIVSRVRSKGNYRSTHLNRNHKYYGRVIVVIWLFTHLGGIFNAVFL
jgi:uncharacterized membrane protein YozB (DUF420 family)